MCHLKSIGEMKLTNSQKNFLLALPILLVLSTALVFVFASKWLGKEFGYLLGFVFYWLVWCLLVPLFILKREGLGALVPPQLSVVEAKSL